MLLLGAEHIKQALKPKRELVSSSLVVQEKLLEGSSWSVEKGLASGSTEEVLGQKSPLLATSQNTSSLPRQRWGRLSAQFLWFIADLLKRCCTCSFPIGTFFSLHNATQSYDLQAHCSCFCEGKSFKSHLKSKKL